MRVTAGAVMQIKAYAPFVISQFFCVTQMSCIFPKTGTRSESLSTRHQLQARREGGCDGCARTPPQTAEVHFFVKKINSKKKKIVLFCLFCSNSLIA